VAFSKQNVHRALNFENSMTNKTPNSFIWLLIVGVIFFACDKPKSETTSSNAAVDTTQLQKLDSVPLPAKSHLKDTILTITADTVRALYYPNTGREVMKLVKKDVCKITRTGRYDVIDGKGNFWIRVERFGGKGWIFGGQTSLESDVWAFSEGMTERGHPYMQYKFHKFSSPTFEGLYKKVGEAIKKAEYKDEEIGTMTVDFDDDEILVTEKETVGKTIVETFKLGPSTDSIKSINYYNVTTEGDTTEFNHTFIAAFDGREWKFVADFYGELKEIMAVNGNYMLASSYDLVNSTLGRVHFTNVVVWSSMKKMIIDRQRFGHSGVAVSGYPIFRRDEDGSFISYATCSFAREGEAVNMQIFETYNQAMKGGTVQDKVYYITRYFTLNSSSLKFEESKQEVIYRAK
jgi:hypothetical protein